MRNPVSPKRGLRKPTAEYLPPLREEPLQGSATPEKKSFTYGERNETRRKSFLTRISRIAPERLVYIDESGFDNAGRIPYGYSPKGRRCFGAVTSRATERLTGIAGQRCGKILSPMLIEGNTNTVVFLKWLKDFLIPSLKPGDRVVMDNASFHKSPKVRQLLRGAGCGLWYLPPYSPDMNPIEHYWAKVKKVHARILLKTGWREGGSVFGSFRKCPNLTD